MAILKLTKTTRTTQEELHLIEFLLRWMDNNYDYLKVYSVEFVPGEQIYRVYLEADGLPLGNHPISICVEQLLPKAYSDMYAIYLPEVLMLSVQF